MGAIAAANIESPFVMGIEGRPSKLTEPLVRKLEEAFGWDATVEQACAHAKIPRTIFYGYLKKNKNFADRMELARHKPLGLAKNAVFKQVSEQGDGDLGLKVLERREKKRYSPRTEVSGPDGAPVAVAIERMSKRKSGELDIIDGELYTKDSTNVENLQRGRKELEQAKKSWEAAALED